LRSQPQIYFEKVKMSIVKEIETKGSNRKL